MRPTRYVVGSDHYFHTCFPFVRLYNKELNNFWPSGSLMTLFMCLYCMGRPAVSINFSRNSEMLFFLTHIFEKQIMFKSITCQSANEEVTIFRTEPRGLRHGDRSIRPVPIMIRFQGNVFIELLPVSGMNEI